MKNTTQCPYCLNKDIRETVIPREGAFPEMTSQECPQCGSYTFDGRDVGPRATEVQMATGWHGNGEDLTSFSPFAPYPQRDAVATHSHSAKWWLK